MLYFLFCLKAADGIEIATPVRSATAGSGWLDTPATSWGTRMGGRSRSICARSSLKALWH